MYHESLIPPRHQNGAIGAPEGPRTLFLCSHLPPMIVPVAARPWPFSPPCNCKWFVAVPNPVGPLSSTVRSQCGLPSRRSSRDHAVALRLRSPPKPEMRVAAANRAPDVIAGSQSILETKNKLYKAVEGIDRGIFGASSEKKFEIEGLVELLESQNPILCPTDHLSRVDGCWKLIYSTISILGSKRTKLGLRGFITLGDFLQTINVSKAKAVNEIKFYVSGFTKFSGKLIVTASFKISSKSRVDINFEESSISPDELMNLFKKNYDLLLAIFNPDGWLEITYVDDSLRIGRDDKGNIFVLEKWQTS